MDAVNAFNTELFAMIEMKPPISRAKMMSVTKSAIKAIKLYKHVVQIVEKFIKKCKPELKVPGLYVVDSIVRQSRHQFGVEKDVFGPRFLKNFSDTFRNLYCCPEDDKNKIIRVLNLWQKNGVFDMEILQPLMDMANGTVVPHSATEVPVNPQLESTSLTGNASDVPSVLPTPEALAAVAQLFQSSHAQELQRMLQNFQQAERTVGTSTIANNITNQHQMPVTQPNPRFDSVKKGSLAEKLLDRFDYDDEPEDMAVSEGKIQTQGIPENMSNQFPVQMRNTDPDMLGRNRDTKHSGGMSHVEQNLTPDGFNSGKESESWENSRENSSTRQEGRDRDYNARSRSSSRSPRRRRSRSSSRSRWSRHRHSRSRERRWRSRASSEDQSDREKDRERRQKGLPSLKSQTLSVCSTTLWVGQLDKKTQQSDVMSLLEEFGQIESINMIPPRGCAYIVMVHRQDAYMALKKLSKGSYKANQKPTKIAWALNKGIKSAHKKFWDVEQGVTYIPWSKVKVEELESYQEGGMLDPETLNPEWNSAKEVKSQVAVNGAMEIVPDVAVSAHVQMPAVPQCEPIGSPPAFPAPIILSPTSLPPRGGPFLHTEFDAAHQVGGNFEAPVESTAGLTGGNDPSSAIGSDNQLGSPTGQVMMLPNPAVMHGPSRSGIQGPLTPGMQCPPRPGIQGPPRPGIQGPPSPGMRGPARMGMQGPPRPGMPPLQPPLGMPNPHMPPFPGPPNMHRMPSQMMPGGPMFLSDRFRMPMPFPPRGPPFQQHPSMGPEIMDDGERGQFRAVRPGFGRPPFQRGRW
ncbi:SR-related and CTD-associated factor 4-like isoform X1 [Poeciliopsis prolifica]|uniref:SR-related and CTD-associated factor 4-like isoform X1 n=1 Tax=Poeciliopsis prolifica TaxID=188132 RepID=UPI002412FE64|nr:SR-related and CTD-associated factor 4-like isoform X1 [Poeciliopsis prolifica]